MSKKGGRKSDTFAPGDSSHKYNIGDIVLAKIKGYPAWPGKIVDPDGVPKGVARERPRGKATYYAVKFYPTAEYTWSTPKELSLLTPREIQAFLDDPAKSKGDLYEGYKVAKDPRAWEADQAEAQAEWERAEADAAEGVDELDDEEEDAGSDDGAAAKKRKRKEAAAPSKGKKKQKLDKLAKGRKSEPTKKSKAAAAAAADVESEDDAPASSKSTEKKAATASKPRKSASAVEDEPASKKSGDGDAEEDPEVKRVRAWRHELQRHFLGKVPLKAEDTPKVDQTLSVVEAADNISIVALQVSKIGKVMKKIAALSDIPRDDEFHFKERASALLQRWQNAIDSQSAGSGGAGAGMKEDVDGDAEMKDAAAEEGSEKKEENGEKKEKAPDNDEAEAEAEAEGAKDEPEPAAAAPPPAQDEPEKPAAEEKKEGEAEEKEEEEDKAKPNGDEA